MASSIASRQLKAAPYCCCCCCCCCCCWFFANVLITARCWGILRAVTASAKPSSGAQAAHSQPEVIRPWECTTSAFIEMTISRVPHNTVCLAPLQPCFVPVLFKFFLHWNVEYCQACSGFVSELMFYSRPIFPLTLAPRDAMIARYTPWLCVWLSVCLSQVGVISKRQNESSWFWHGSFIYTL